MDFKLPVVANEAQLSEPIHEEVDSRAGRSYHLNDYIQHDFLPALVLLSAVYVSAT